MREFEWSDKQGSRDRKAWLLLVKADKIHAFEGANVPGVAAIKGSDYEKSGKWSHTTYRLILANGVQAHPLRAGWETGTFREAINADTWIEAANRLNVSIPSVQGFLREWAPKAACHYDDVDVSLSELDEAECDGTDVITVSFGSPTSRERENGYWDIPVIVLDDRQQTIDTLSPSGGYTPSDERVKLLDKTRTSGHGEATSPSAWPYRRGAPPNTATNACSLLKRYPALMRWVTLIFFKRARSRTPAGQKEEIKGCR